MFSWQKIVKFFRVCCRDLQIFVISQIEKYRKLCKISLFHCIKNVRFRSFSSPYFPAFGLNTSKSPYSGPMRDNADQKNSKYGHFLRSVFFRYWNLTDYFLPLLAIQKVRTSEADSEPSQISKWNFLAKIVKG